MTPEQRHTFVNSMLLQVNELKDFLQNTKGADLNVPEVALQLLSAYPATLTIGQNKYSHLSIITFKAHFLRDWFLKHYAKNTSLPPMEQEGKPVPKHHVKKLGAPAFQRRLEPIIRVALERTWTIMEVASPQS